MSGPMLIPFPGVGVAKLYYGGSGDLNICQRRSDQNPVLFDEDAAGSLCPWPKDGMPKGSHLVQVMPCWASTPMCAVIKVAVTKLTNKVTGDMQTGAQLQ